jgi:hypothetical protein
MVAAPNRLAVQSVTGDYYDNTDELQSFFGRVNYAIAGKYLFSMPNKSYMIFFVFTRNNKKLRGNAICSGHPCKLFVVQNHGIWYL